VRLIIHIDGGARGNPGEAGFGVAVSDLDGRRVADLFGYLGVQTNNVAEYAALLAALKYAIEADASTVLVRSDSELLVRQIKGVYRVKHPGLIPLHEAAKRLMARLPEVRVEHVRREQNRDADRLANQAMDTKSDDPAGVSKGLPLPRRGGAA